MQSVRAAGGGYIARSNVASDVSGVGVKLLLRCPASCLVCSSRPNPELAGFFQLMM